MNNDKRGSGETSDLVRLERLLSALELTNTFVFDQDRDLRFIRVYNPMYGYTDEAFVGKSDEDFISADYARKIAPVKRRVLKTGKPEQVDFSAEVAGELRHFILRISQLKNDKGEVEGVTIVGSDVSEMKKSDGHRTKMMLQLEQMQRYESMAVMAEGISHDFNNLLSGIFGYIDLAHDSTIDPKTRQYIGKALTTIDRARALTKDLVTYAKGGAPQKRLGEISIWLRDQALSVLEGRAVRLKFSIEENLPLVAYDEQQIGRVIEVLATNAYQAATEAGRAVEITISAEVLMIEAQAVDGLGPGAYVCIKVADNGPGISSELQDKIFEPYFSTKGQGRGLGLATSNSILQHHNGALELTSSTDKGSVFSVYLPAEAYSEQRLSGKNKRGKARAGHVLLMDDDEFILDAFSDVLISLGYSVSAAKNGNDALSLVRSDPSGFSAIILDLHVETGGGAKDVISELRTLVGDLPVFVASGSVDDEAMLYYERYGFTDRIDKPYKRKELASLLRNHIGR